MSASAAVFAYHDVGVRCLGVLLARGLRVPLVVTHRDDARENVWFASVERFAREHDLPVETPEDPNDAGFVARLSALAPDFLFSFYYRQMLSPAVLATARRGAFNMHGSLLPRYRGRAPVNWAVLRGEHETGATLHEMTARPDAGRIAGRMAVPILPDDQALDVFRKVTVAAELVLDRALAGLVDGSLALEPQDLAAGSYFGGRRPEDGRIDWSRPAVEVHNLVRAVAPPYPGAFTPFRGGTLRVLRSRVLAGRRTRPGAATLGVAGEALEAACADGGVLRLLAIDFDGLALDAAGFAARFGAGPHPLGN